MAMLKEIFVEPISRVGYGAYRNQTESPGRSGTNSFSESLKLAKAEGLLRSTGQYEKWTQLCQNNDGIAVKVADLVIKRHELLNASKLNHSVDRKLFDKLTEELKSYHIFLYKSSDLFSEQVLSTTQNENTKSSQPTPLLISSSNNSATRMDTWSISNSEVVAEVKGEPPYRALDQDFLVINVQYKKFILNNGLIGYGDSKRQFLPLEEMAKTLDFMIDVDGAAGKADGWFISEDRSFHLDLSKMEVTVSGEKKPVPKESIIVDGTEIYVDGSVLSQWFPVDFLFDFPSQSLEIRPNEKLPFQKRLEREQQGIGKGTASMGNPSIYPRKYSEYNILSLPMVDIGASTRYGNNAPDDDGLKSDFYFLLKGDLGKMTSEVYFSGDDEDGLDNSRMTLRRDDPDGNLLGPLKATSVSAGDIRTAAFPILSTADTERGIGVSNEDLNRKRQYDTTFFEGNLPPGWDVELYRNTMLLNTQRVGAEGKYTFNDVPLYYGKNDFSLKFYGPQGQKRVENKRIDVGNDLQKKGTGKYDVTLTQKDAGIYDPEKIINTLDEETLNLNARYSYGLLKNLSINAGISSQEVNKDRHNYINLGAKGTLEGIYLSSDYLHDTGGGNALELFGQTGLGKLDLNVKQQFFNDFIDDSGVGYSDPLKSKTDVSVSGRIGKSTHLPDIPFTINYQHTQRENSDYNSLGARLSTNINDISLNNYLEWTNRDSLSSNYSVLDGNFQAIAYLGDHRARGKLNYEIEPETKIKSAELSYFLNVGDHLSTELIVRNDMDQDRVERAVKLNWNNGKFIISPRVSYDSNDEFMAMLSISTSFGMEPRSKKVHMSSHSMADKGAASVRVFNDKNYNAVFDDEDELVEGASVKAVQSGQSAETNNAGVAFLTHLQKNKPTDIVLNKDTLKDPFWEPVAGNYSVVPRPGHVQKMDIPVVTTGEIDGMVLIETEDGREKILSNVPVQLIDASGKVVQEVRSEFDGFYYFQKVFPGEYTVRIDPDNKYQVNRTHATKEVMIDNQGTVASGMDIFLSKPDIQESKPVIAAEKTESIPVAKLSSIISGPAPISLESTATTATGAPKYGLHLTSYRTQEKAVAGIKYLMDKYKDILGASDFSVKKVKVSDEKGTWYRVFAGSFDKMEDADKLKEKIKLSSPYCKILPLSAKDPDKEDTSMKRGVHLTSYRTRENAIQGIKELKNNYPELLKNEAFTIKTIDLGPGRGIWKRVVAGRFSDINDATLLARKIKMKLPYGKVIEIEKENDFAIHMASYKTLERATRGVVDLQKKYSSILNDSQFSIRRVDLGKEKGVWYRIFAGKFEDKALATSLQKAFKRMNQYAGIVRLTP